MDKIKIFKKDFHRDQRGDLWTLWNKKDGKTNNLKFNHDKVSTSKKNVLRGIHGDFKSWKLITCLYGSIFFVIVDNRKNSKNYLNHRTFNINANDKFFFLIPPGFGNGFYVKSKIAIFYYKWSYKGDYPDVNKQFTIKWNDPSLNIKWPCKKPILQERDK